MRKLLVVFLLFSYLAWAQEIRRPTADSDPGATTPCIGTVSDATTSGANAYDGSGTATSVTYTSNGVVNTSSGVTHHSTRLFTSWAVPSGPYTSLSLNVNSACSDDQLNAGGDCIVQFSTDTGSTWTTIKSDNSLGGWAQQTNTTTLATNQTFSALQVRVCADGDGSTVASGINAGSGSITTFDIWTSGVLLPPPAAPTGLSATPAANGLSVSLSWTDNATNETSYQINKCTGVSCTPVSYQTGLAANLTSFNDTTGVSPGTTYGYQACAVNAAGAVCSTTATATTPTAPATPSGLTATYSNTTVSLSWTDNATNETSYTVQRCLASGCTPADYSTGLAANSTTFNDTVINGKTTYVYQVVALNAVGASGASNQITVITPGHQAGSTSHQASQ